MFPHHINTLPSGHAEMHDRSPEHCWRVTHFYVFLSRRPAHLFAILPGSLIASRLSTAWCRMLGTQVTNKQTRHDPLLLKPLDTNKGTTHSDTLFVFLQLQSWLCVGMFWKRTIFCVSYTQIHVLMSLIIVTVKVWTVTVTSLQLVHVNNCDLLVHWLPQFPHPFFLTSIKIIFVKAWDWFRHC
jgi:hypothetical protein